MSKDEGAAAAPRRRNAQSLSASIAGEGLSLRASKHRLVQVGRAGKRKLFDRARREIFLEWFAATCNVKLSAAKAGVHHQTVFKHRMKDQAFAEAWDRALEQGYARLEARLLAEAGGYPDGRRDGAEEYEIAGDLDGPEVEAAFDRDLAIQLLREHARRLPRSADKRKDRRTSARTATNAEVADALAKRLKSFALRVQREGEARRTSASDAATDGGSE